MFEFFGLSDYNALAQFAAVGCLAAIAAGALAIVRRRRDRRSGTAVIAGTVIGLEPYVGVARRATIQVKKPDGGYAKEVFLFFGKASDLAAGTPAAFLIHGGLCCAYRTASGLGAPPSLPRRLVQFWPRCVLVPFAGFFFSSLLMTLAAMGGNGGDARLIAFWQGAWAFFILAGYASVFISLRRLQAALRGRFSDLQRAFSSLE